MTIGKDTSSQQLARIRRENPGETDAQVVAFTDEEGGQPVSLFGAKDEGPYVSPVGDRPSRSTAYNYLNNWAIPLLGDGTGDNVTWNSVDPSPFLSIDVREWRTVVFNVQYTAGRRNTIEGPVVLGQSLFRFQGSFVSEQVDFFTPVVLDGTLVTVPEYGEGFRTAYPADIRSQALSINDPPSRLGSISFDMSFDVDPYDFVRLLCSEVVAAAGPGFNTTYVPGRLTIRYRTVR